MNKALHVLALFLGAIKPSQVFETPQDLSPTESEAFTIGFNDAMEGEDDTLVNKPYADEGQRFEYVESGIDIAGDSTQLTMWED